MGAKIDPIFFPEIYPGRSGFRSCDQLIPRWLQDHPKRAPGEVLGSSWGGLGPLLGALGPSLDGLGGGLGPLLGGFVPSWEGLGWVLGRFWRLLDALGTVLEPSWDH